MNISDTSEFKRIIQRYPKIRHRIGDYLNVTSFNEMEKSFKVIRFFGRYVQLLIRNEHTGQNELARVPHSTESIEEKRADYQEFMSVLCFGEDYDICDVDREFILWMPIHMNIAVGVTYKYYLSLFDKQSKYGKKVKTELICHPSIEPYYTDFYTIRCKICESDSCPYNRVNHYYARDPNRW